MIVEADVHISPFTEGNRIHAEEALCRMDRAGVDKALTWLQPSYIPNVRGQNAYIYTVNPFFSASLAPLW